MWLARGNVLNTMDYITKQQQDTNDGNKAFPGDVFVSFWYLEEGR